MTINEWVKKIRQDAGLSIRTVSEESNSSVPAIYRYENGSRKVPVSYVRYWILKGYPINWEEINEDIRHT